MLQISQIIHFGGVTPHDILQSELTLFCHKKIQLFDTQPSVCMCLSMTSLPVLYIFLCMFLYVGSTFLTFSSVAYSAEPNDVQWSLS